MIDLTLDTKDWKVTEAGWKIAPSGLHWIKEGYYLKCGNYTKIGNYAKIGDYAEIGNYAKIGNYTKIGNYAKIGDYAEIGNYAKIGNYTKIGDCTIIGDCAKIGDCTTEFVCVGYAEGYSKTLCLVEGIAYIGAGCRWFTLSDAIKHWSNKPERELTLCLMESAKAIANLKGWKYE